MLSEQLTPKVVDERVKAAREVLEEKISNVDKKVDDKILNLDKKVDDKIENVKQDLTEVDNKYDRWATSIERDFKKEVDRLDQERKEDDGKRDLFEKDMINTLHELQLAQEKGERIVLEEAERDRVTKNRWIIGTVISVAALGYTIIAEILLK